MWPLHFFCCVWCFKMGHRFVEIFDEWPKLLINLFLLQSWYNDSEIFFAYNGVSWFLSSILFCYFLSPLLMVGLKTNRSVSVSFIFVVFIRIFTELLAQGQWSVYIPINFHIFPVIRAMDFYLGMTMFGFYKYIMAFLKRNAKYESRLLFSVLETIVLFVTVALVIIKNNVWIRGYYVRLVP